MASRTLLVGFDGSEGSCRAARWAMQLASNPAGGTEIALLAAVGLPPIPRSVPGVSAEDLLAAHEDQLRNAAGPLLEAAQKAGVPARPELVRASPFWQLLEHASLDPASLLVLGAHQHPGFRLPLGSVALAVVRRTKNPVVVVRGSHWHSPPQRVVWADDGSASAKRAFALARDWFVSAQFSTVTVVPHSRKLEETVGFPLPPPREPGPAIELPRRYLEGDPATQVLAELEREPVDLVVLGRRGLSPLQELFLGSVSHKILEHAPCPLFLVP